MDYPMFSYIEKETHPEGQWVSTYVQWNYRYPSELKSALETFPFYGWICPDPIDLCDMPDVEWTTLKGHQWAVAMAENHAVKSGNSCQLSDILEAYLHMQGVDNWSFLESLLETHVNPNILGVLRALPM